MSHLGIVIETARTLEELMDVAHVVGVEALTPAMDAGLADHVWTIEEILDKAGLKKKSPNLRLGLS
jgi:hypothetical protein